MFAVTPSSPTQELSSGLLICDGHEAPDLGHLPLRSRHNFVVHCSVSLFWNGMCGHDVS